MEHDLHNILITQQIYNRLCTYIYIYILAQLKLKI